MALGGVDAGIATPDFTVFCTGSITLGNHEFHCWKQGGHGRIDLKSAIQKSCDIFFYELARRLGIDKIDEAAHKLGLGAPTGIELPGERSGLIPPKAWKQATFGVPWQQGETLITGIGQGYVLTTPLQLCTLAARIASGKAVSPRITRYSRGPAAETRACRRRWRFRTRRWPPCGRAWMRSATSRAARPMPGASPSRASRWPARPAPPRSAASPWRSAPGACARTASFPGSCASMRSSSLMRPSVKPRYACAVIIEHGAAVAHYQVQMARDILLFTQKRDPANLPTAYPVASAGLHDRA